MTKQRPSGFIQWKGTNACIDLHCTCGNQWHVDADFLYRSVCPHCGQWYELHPHIALTPIPTPEDA